MYVLSRSVMSDSLQPHRLQPTRLLCPWGFSRQEQWSGLPCLPPWDLPNTRIKPRSPTLQADSLPSEPPRKPESHSVMATPWVITYQAPLSMEFSRQEYWSGQPFPSPEIFLTQELNPGLPHCRWILYHLNHQGSPKYVGKLFITEQASQHIFHKQQQHSCCQ